MQSSRRKVYIADGSFSLSSVVIKYIIKNFIFLYINSLRADSIGM